jgi:YD repeat-containing protein
MIKKLLLIIILIGSLLAEKKLQAAVNMRNGGYTESWIDFIDPGQGYPLRIERHYSSRSLFNGLFGFGWCSNLETFIEVTTDGILNLTECGGGLETTYYPDNFDTQSPEHTIARILEHVKSEKKLTTNDIKNLQTQLSANTRMRFEYANKLHLVDTKKIKTQKNTFHAKSRGLEKIVFDGNSYERQKPNGASERFDQSGRLIQITQNSGLWVKLYYKGQSLAYVADNNGRRLNFTYGADSRLARISNGSGLTATYKFQGNNLVSVTNMWKKSYNYQYDNAHNLTHVAFPDGSSLRMTYDTANDWIKTYTNRLNCRETYNFTMSNTDPKNHYWATVEKVCDKKKVASGKNEFWYKPYNFSTDKYLHRVQETSQQNFRDAFFHPFLGRPVSLRENDVYRGYAYFLNGLVNKEEFKRYQSTKKVSDWTKSTYKYDKNGTRIVQIETIILNPEGKPSGKKVSSYDYNSRGQLQRVKTSQSESLLISYDSSGRLHSLKNHQNAEIKLSYTVGQDKPTSISQSGLGSINIKYDTSGEIAGVESDKQRKIASSVIESFLSMIELLGPMGEELKL